LKRDSNSIAGRCSDWAASEDRSEKLAAGSGPIACGVCDAIVNLVGRIEAETAPRAGVEFLGDSEAPVLTELIKRSAAGQVLAKQAVGVLKRRR
jgi:hypothetical protein